MRITWHSHSPVASTGYGTPSALWLPALKAMGHDVTASAFTGQHMDFTWQGIKVVSTDDGQFGATRLRALTKNADVLITLMDVWVYPPALIDSLKLPALNWFPVDTSPLSVLDERYFRHSKATPVAMSEHGGRMLTEAGIDGTAIPYAFDPAVFYPDDGDRQAARAGAGLDGLFAIGANAANIDRKAWPELLQAYARLWREHPGQVILLANTTLPGPGPAPAGALSLLAITRRLGLPDAAVRWIPAGTMDQPALASWYRSLDVLSACSFAEGFGLPIAEAEACGTPVIVTAAPPASTEIGLPGRHVACEPAWQQSHQAWWHRPSVTALHEALEDAYAHRSDRAQASAAAAAHAKRYELGNVAPLWAALLERTAR
jgi:glycosyltransferase involved in cell wall biosynthesis